MFNPITKDHYVFITGATSGIGLATARAFQQKGYGLILNGRREERLLELKKEFASTPVVLAPFDVADVAAVQSWCEAHQNDLKKIGVLVNNAGLARGTDPIHKGSEADWNEMIDTNIKGLLAVTARVIPHFVARSCGHIVNLGSVAGRWTYPGGAVYSATKFAVRALSEGFRMDLIGTGVRVTNIEPGMVETEFSEVRFRDKDKAKQVYRGMTPLSGEDIARTILWAVEQPPHVNIQELVIYPTDQASLRDVHRG